MDANELLTVYTLTDANQAELIKASLQSEGIACAIDGEQQAGLSHVLEIGIMVRAKDADAARRLIEGYEHHGRKD